MAQLVAHSLWERGVVSSSLAAPTILRLSGASASASYEWHGQSFNGVYFKQALRDEEAGNASF